MVILENIDIDKAILQNIDIDKISNRFKFGISNRATEDWVIHNAADELIITKMHHCIEPSKTLACIACTKSVAKSVFGKAKNEEIHQQGKYLKLKTPSQIFQVLKMWKSSDLRFSQVHMKGTLDSKISYFVRWNPFREKKLDSKDFLTFFSSDF